MKVKNKIILYFIIVTLIAFCLRIFLFNFKSNDFLIFLDNWLNFFKNNGGLKGIKYYYGDYNAPYVFILALLSYIPINNLYLIKAVSIIFDFLLALAGGYLSYNVSNNKKLGLVTYASLLFLPQVVANSALWGQCDSIYCFFSVMSLIFLLKEKYIKSFIFLGISFSFKLQFIFILPLYIYLYVTERKISFFHFFIIPLVECILCIPNIICGMFLENVIMIYVNQIIQYTEILVFNYPNIYQIINPNLYSKILKFNIFSFTIISKVGVVITYIIVVLILLYLLKINIKWTKEKIINMALLSIALVTYFLPCMHERYVFVGEILSIIYFILYKKNLLFCIVINLNAIITYTIYLGNLGSFVPDFLYIIMALIYGIVLIRFTINTLKFMNDKEIKKVRVWEKKKLCI